MQVACRGMEVTWQPPQSVGHPPFHKYKLQRTSDPEGQSEWRSVNRQVDVESTSWIDRQLQVLLHAGLPCSSAAAPAFKSALIAFSTCQQCDEP